MANHTYVPSNCIYIFPCAKRAYNNSAASKFLTQYNLTHLTGGGKSYNLTKTNDTYMRFSVMGYFVQVDYTSQQGQTWWENFLTAAKPKANDVLYAYIKLASDATQLGGFSDILDVNTQSKLTSFETATELDKAQGGTSLFTALKLAFLAKDSQANGLQGAKVKLATVTSANPIALQWQVYSEVLKFAEGSENNGITIQLSQSVSTQEISAKATNVAIGTEQLVDNAVTHDKMDVDQLAYGVTAAATSADRLQVQLVNNSGKLKAQLLGLIQTADIANGAVTGDKLAGDAVTENKLATDAVTTAKLKDKSVTTGKLQNAVQTKLSHIGQLYIGATWYPISLSADEKTLYIGNPPAAT